MAPSSSNIRCGGSLIIVAERPGSGDGEREASMTRQMPYEPLPASVLFAFGVVSGSDLVFVRLNQGRIVSSSSIVGMTGESRKSS